MLVAAFVRDVACDMVSDPAFVVSSNSPKLPPHVEDTANVLNPIQISWPERSRSWRLDPSDEHPSGQLMPGVFQGPGEFGILPRQRVLDGWNPSLDNVVPAFHPVCLSTRTTDPAYNLTPIATEGWAHWVHPEYTDKPYLVATKPGSWAKFELETGLGVVKIYALKSRSFGLGSVSCWIGDERDQAVVVDGSWDQDA